MNYNYYNYYKNCKESSPFRFEMVKYAREHGNKRAAREFRTTVKTVRKWVSRYEAIGQKGLTDQSKKPKNSPRAMKLRWQFCIKTECQKAMHPDTLRRLNAHLLQKEYSIPYSTRTILKYMRNSGYGSTRKKKSEKKRDMREAKLKYKPLEKLQVDVKYTDDIPEFYRYYRHFKLPRYQITARCIRTGATFISYMYENTVTNSSLFMYCLYLHFEKHNVSMKGMRIQTDNGSEFVKPNSLKDSLFTKTVNKLLAAEHRRIPPGAKTWQSDVESFHRLVEDEFYSCTHFTGYSDFFEKSHHYMRHFNEQRMNHYKQGIPADLVKQNSDIQDTAVLDFKPVVLDKEMPKRYNELYQLVS